MYVIIYSRKRKSREIPSCEIIYNGFYGGVPYIVLNETLKSFLPNSISLVKNTRLDFQKVYGS